MKKQVLKLTNDIHRPVVIDIPNLTITCEIVATIKLVDATFHQISATKLSGFTGSETLFIIDLIISDDKALLHLGYNNNYGELSVAIEFLG